GASLGRPAAGTLPTGGAARGWEGPRPTARVSGTPAWYTSSRPGGVRQTPNSPGGSLTPTVTTGPNPPEGVNLPNRRPLCAALNSYVNTIDGDASGDVNEFWRARDYNLDPSKIKAAVFATHGYQDDNVRMDHEGMWWNTLEQAGVPHKLWLMDTGHTDPFESRRSVWVDTLHRWFDHYLLGVSNGIDKEPRVTIEESPNVWKDYTDWPIPGTSTVNLFLKGASDTAPGSFGENASGGKDTVSFTGSNSTSETQYMNTPDGAQANRHVFISK